MPRTPEQKAASEALEVAIKNALVSHGVEYTDAFLSEFVVMTCHQGFEIDGVGNARYNYFMMGDGQPWHRCIGLVDQVRRKMVYDMYDSFVYDEEDES